MRLSQRLNIDWIIRYPLIEPKTRFFSLLQHKKYRFIISENLFHAADAMRSGLVFTLCLNLISMTIAILTTTSTFVFFLFFIFKYARVRKSEMVVGGRDVYGGLCNFRSGLLLLPLNSVCQLVDFYLGLPLNTTDYV